MQDRYKGTGLLIAAPRQCQGRVKTVPREDKGQAYSNNRGRSRYSCATDHLRRFAGLRTEARVAADNAAPAPKFRAEEAHPTHDR